MSERTPQALADAFEPLLAGKRCPVNLRCESKAEAAAVAAELKRRGWKVTATWAINLATGKSSDVARVTGRQKGKR